jgi:hypothetical protein
LQHISTLRRKPSAAEKAELLERPRRLMLRIASFKRKGDSFLNLDDDVQWVTDVVRESPEDDGAHSVKYMDLVHKNKSDKSLKVSIPRIFGGLYKTTEGVCWAHCQLSIKLPGGCPMGPWGFNIQLRRMLAEPIAV